MTTDSSPSECRPIAWIARDRLLRETERLRDLPRRRPEHRIRSQVEIVRGQIGGRTIGRASSLGGLQCRFDNAGNAGSHFVLKIEHVFERAVEPVSPEMRAGIIVNQLAGDAHAITRLAHRAFEHVSYAQFAPDPLYVDRLALVGEA